MHVDLTPRGFERINLLQHPGAGVAPVVQESSIADGFIWIGDRHHLDAQQARELGERLIRWAGCGTLRLPDDGRCAHDCACRTSPQIPDADRPTCNVTDSPASDSSN